MLVVILMKHLQIYAYPNDIASRNSGTHKVLSCNEEVIIQNTDIESMEASPCNSHCSEFFL